MLWHWGYQPGIDVIEELSVQHLIRVPYSGREGDMLTITVHVRGAIVFEPCEHGLLGLV